jgi:large subunit ribosomal protein L24
MPDGIGAVVVKVKIRKGDLVEVISGRDKNKRGEVIRVLAEERRIVIAGINIRKKHEKQRPTSGRTLPAGIIEFEAPIHISNVMLVCPSCNEPSRVALQRQEDKVVRMCKHCGAAIDK